MQDLMYDELFYLPICNLIHMCACYMVIDQSSYLYNQSLSIYSTHAHAHPKSPYSSWPKKPSLSLFQTPYNIITSHLDTGCTRPPRNHACMHMIPWQTCCDPCSQHSEGCQANSVRPKDLGSGDVLAKGLKRWYKYRFLVAVLTKSWEISWRVLRENQ